MSVNRNSTTRANVDYKLQRKIIDKNNRIPVCELANDENGTKPEIEKQLENVQWSTHTRSVRASRQLVYGHFVYDTSSTDIHRRRLRGAAGARVPQ